MDLHEPEKIFEWENMFFHNRGNAAESRIRI